MKAWMKSVPDNFLVSEINLPGTHNSATKRVRFSLFSKCQNLSIFEQLNIGIRFLDIRVEKVGSRLKLIHGIADCLKPDDKKERLFLEDVLQDCYDFLKINPTEAVFFCLKRDDGVSQEDVFDTFFENYLNDDTLWYTENRIPTMGEARGRLVLLRRCCINTKNKAYNDYNTGLNFTGWCDHSKPVENGYSVVPIPRLKGNAQEAFLLQDMYKLKPAEKWAFAVYPLLDNPPKTDGIILNFFSANTLIKTPKAYAKYMLKRFKNVKLTPFKKYGWLILDFPTEKLCKKIVLTNF